MHVVHEDRMKRGFDDYHWITIKSTENISQKQLSVRVGGESIRDYIARAKHLMLKLEQSGMKLNDEENKLVF